MDAAELFQSLLRQHAANELLRSQQVPRQGQQVQQQQVPRAGSYGGPQAADPMAAKQREENVEEDVIEVRGLGPLLCCQFARLRDRRSTKHKRPGACTASWGGVEQWEAHDIPIG